MTNVDDDDDNLEKKIMPEPSSSLTPLPLLEDITPMSSMYHQSYQCME